jgi:hypothetical protein
MQTSAKIIADSTYKGSRLTTMEVTFHRFVLAEFNTHRVFSRNSASSRAIPVEKQLMRALETPAFPLEWPAEQPGMQGGAELTGKDLSDAKGLLYEIWQNTTAMISQYIKDHPDKSTRLHKGHLNRPMEWFMYHTVIVTSDQYANFFAQRCHKDAQPEIRALAELMREAYNESTPSKLLYGDLHAPYTTVDDWIAVGRSGVAKMSSARCARVSYMTHDGVVDFSADFRLFDRLTSQDPGHWSPLEHVAFAGMVDDHETANGNFIGEWSQLRYIYEKGFTIDDILG